MSSECDLEWKVLDAMDYMRSNHIRRIDVSSYDGNFELILRQYWLDSEWNRVYENENWE